MKRIGVFLTSEPNNGGMHQYAQEVVDALCASSDIDPVVFYCHKSWEDYLSNRSITTCDMTDVSDSYTKGTIIDNKCCELVIVLYDISISEFMMTDCIGIIHDQMHIYEPDTLVRNDKEYMEGALKYFHMICENSVAILVDSELGKKHVMEQYGYVHEKKIFPLSFACPQELLHISSENARMIEGKYFFYPAQLTKIKNHVRLIRAVALLHSKGIFVRLVLVGPHKEAAAEIEELIKTLGLEKEIIYLGYVSATEMKSLYIHARALVMPTLHGPTNIPPIEAMTLGCPVAVSNIYAMPEQVGDAGLTFNPYNVEEIAAVMERLWLDDKLCCDLAERGKKRSALFSFSHFSKQLNAILTQVMLPTEYLHKAIHTLQKYQNIYIYGVGFWGKRICCYLQCYNLPVKGFIVTEKRKEQAYLDYMISSVHEVQIECDSVIFIAVAEDKQREIIETLEMSSICDVPLFLFNDIQLKELNQWLWSRKHRLRIMLKRLHIV